MRTVAAVDGACADGGLDTALEELTATLLAHAPLSTWAAERAVVRLRRAALPDDADLVRTVHGSTDSHAGVAAFVARERVSWTGR